MMATTASTDPPELDLHVEASPPSSAPPPPPGSALLQHHHPHPHHPHHHHPPPPPPPPNPLDTAPSSPSQIYLNLLILEASLRSQYLNHLGRRRKFTFFLIVLCLWTAFFGHRFFVLGGSPYYYISHFEKLGLGGGVVTGALYYATGLYDTTIVEPRQFVSSANRGLRGFNVKLVKIPLSYREWIHWWWGWYTFKVPTAQLLHQPMPRRPSSNTRRPTPPVPSHSHTPSLSSMALKRPPPLQHHDDEDDEDDEVEEYLPGGLHIKLLILAKGFSPDFREGWELYRTEYWDKENEARQSRRRDLKARRYLKSEEAVYVSPAPEKRVRTGSMSSSRGRTPTPDPDRMIPISRPRRGSTASLKRRSTVPRASAPDVSDSGSTTSALGGERERTRRSESIRTDISSSSAGSQARKAGGRGRGKKRSSGGMDEEEH